MKKAAIQEFRQLIGKSSKDFGQGFSRWHQGVLEEMDEQGELCVRIEVREDMLNPLGTLHGGSISGIVDDIMGFYIFLKSDETAAHFALNLSVDFIKTARQGDQIYVRPRVVRIGRKTANIACTISLANGTVIATASSNYLQIN